MSEISSLNGESNSHMSLDSKDSYENDSFMQNLQNKTMVLQQCQQSKGFSSCSMCEQLIGCGIRVEYVRAVYESMSKGQQGDFDFN